MRLAGAVFVLVLAAGRTAAGDCPTCSRVWFEGTLQRVVWFGGDNISPLQQRALDLGDLNGDGRADIAAADGSIFTWFAHADGILRPGPTLSPGNQSRGVAIADMDGDGALDVIAGGLGVGVTRGDGQGGFLPPSPGVGASAHIQNLAIADFDGDGRPDVAAVHGQNANLVSIYRGTGGGGLAQPTTLPTTGRAFCLDTGDFDGDGRPDLAVGYNLPTRVALFRNAGGGTFLPAVLYPTIPNNLDLLAADLDGDGDTDVAVAGAGLAGAQVLYGDGNGALAPGPTLAVSDLSYAIAAGDFDGDGDLDLAHDDNSDNILVSHREANGLYSTPQALFIDEGLNALEAGDWNGDGRPDLVMGALSGVQLLRPDIGPGIAPAAQHNLGRPDGLWTDDFNNDGVPDLFVHDRLENNQSSLWLGDGALGFNYSGFLMPGGVQASADFNGDGNRDIVTLSATYLGNGAGGFTMSAPVGAPVVADFNVDGRPDLLSLTIDPFAGIGVFSVRLGDGTGGFGAPVSTTISVLMFSPGVIFAAGRFDGDNLPDLSYSHASTQYLMRGDGAGGFSTATFIPGSSSASQMVAGDFNGDGYSDTMAGGEVKWGGPSGLTDGPGLTMFTGGGYFLKVGDANGDGLDDVIASHATSPGPDLTVVLGDQAGNLRLLGLTTGGGGGGTAIADWNGDGRPDLAVGRTQLFQRILMFPASACQPVALGLVTAPSSCHTPGTPFATQPVVAAMDVAGNVVCPSGAVTATLMPGTGTAGALLGGTTTVPLVDGTATFADLSVDQPGRRYRLSFDSPGLVPVTSPTFSQGLAPVVMGSALACPGRPELYEVGPGYDAYEWRLDGTFQATSAAVLLDLPTGPHTVAVTVEQDACSATDSLPVASAPPSIDITVVGPTTVCPACTAGLFGANAIASENAPLQWGYRTQSGGAITPLAGETGPNYRLAGSDFPGPGAYLVVASVECGPTVVSNEIPVTVAPPPLAQEIAHGARVQEHLGPPAAGVRHYLLAQEARSSYEVVIEGTSGDIGVGQGPLVEHIAGDGLTVIGSAAPVGAGPSRSLRIVNAGASRVVDFVRVGSASCGTDCGADDVYTLRAYETTLRASRFNNAGSQTTVVLLQNSGSGTVAGEVHFWSATGARLAGQPFVLGPRELLVLPAAGLPALAATGGSITISHDGSHGSLAGKTVAIEPAAGFSFDTPFTVRAR